MINKRLILMVLMCFGSFSWAETGILKRVITVEIRNTPIKTILLAIEKRAAVQFSYNPNFIEEDKIVSLSIHKKTIAYGLSLIFNKSVRFKEVGNHIVLLKNEDSDELKKRKKSSLTTHFTGVISDKRTGIPIVGASIYDVDARFAAISNSKGEYSLKIPKAETIRSLYIRKKGYREFVFVTDVSVDTLIVKNVVLERNLREIEKITQRDAKRINLPVVERILSGELVSYDTYIHAENLAEIDETRWAQISLVPSVGIGSNLSTNGLITNRISLNILSGYSNGVNGLEIGGVLNIVKGDVSGVQIGGISNLVGGSLTGVQLGGILTSVKGNLKGIQIGGITSKSSGDFLGAQISGINSLNNKNFKGLQLGGILTSVKGNSEGLQLGGIFSKSSGDFLGIQIAGIISKNHKNFRGLQLGGIKSVIKGNFVGLQIGGLVSASRSGFKGLQISGISNSADSSSLGFQLSGIHNTSYGDLKGGQFSGISNFSNRGINYFQGSAIANIADKNNGVQATGIFNFARKNNGLQIGLINTSVEGDGIAIGLINFSLKGYHKTEIGTNEIFPLNLSFKSGTKRLYNSYNFGVKFGDTVTYAFGLGLGTQFQLKEKWALSLDLTSQMVFNNNFNKFEFIQLYKFAPIFDYQLAKWVAVFLGPSISMSIDQYTNEAGIYNASLGGFPIYENNFKNGQMQLLLGGRVGFRF